MRKTILATLLSAIALTGAASPALAHDNDRYPGGNRAEAAYLTPHRNADIRHDIWQLDNRIAMARDHRAISRREAQGLFRQARDVKQMYSRYADGGLSPGEYRQLERRVDNIQSRLHAEKWDRDGHRG